MFTYYFAAPETFAKLSPIPQFACSALTIDISAYAANHGCLPRGKGRWMFKCQQPSGDWVLLCFEGPGAYQYWSEAKEHALTLADTYGFIQVAVLN